MFFALVWIAAAIVIGKVGQNRKFGFWGYFFCSLLLSPLIAVLLVLGSDPR